MAYVSTWRGATGDIEAGGRREGGGGAEAGPI